MRGSSSRSLHCLHCAPRLSQRSYRDRSNAMRGFTCCFCDDAEQMISLSHLQDAPPDGGNTNIHFTLTLTDTLRLFQYAEVGRNRGSQSLGMWLEKGAAPPPSFLLGLLAFSHFLDTFGILIMLFYPRDNQQLSHDSVGVKG